MARTVMGPPLMMESNPSSSTGVVTTWKLGTVRAAIRQLGLAWGESKNA